MTDVPGIPALTERSIGSVTDWLMTDEDEIDDFRAEALKRLKAEHERELRRRSNNELPPARPAC